LLDPAIHEEFTRLKVGEFPSIIPFLLHYISLYQHVKMMQHKVVEEQLHLAATMRTAQMLREPPQRAALDIALGALC
jgi:hypothetical protein